MWFLRRFLLLSLVIAAFVPTGHAVTSDWDGITWVAATPAPEINPTWTAPGSCILAAPIILRHSAKFRK